VASLTNTMRPPVRELESVPYPAMTVRQRLEVMELSDHEWRVCDADLDEGDAHRVLGYVEKRGWHYELTRLRSPGERLRFLSLTDSLEALGHA
jgi:hypothetical protein